MARTKTLHPGDRGVGRSGRSGGFSLVELLVVLSIIALVAGLAVPVLRTTSPRYELSGTANAMSSAIRAARAAAIARNREVIFELDVDTGKFGANLGGKGGAVPGGAGIELVAARTEIVGGTRGRIRFYPDGTSTGGEVKIRRSGHTATVRVDWFNGQVDLGYAAD